MSLEKLDCIFCRMVLGEVKVHFLYQDLDFFCIQDHNPQAKRHFLIIPKLHLESLESWFLTQSDQSLPADWMSRFWQVTLKVVHQYPDLSSGFRCVLNTGPAGGQTVPHLHLHVLGGGVLQEGALGLGP